MSPVVRLSAAWLHYAPGYEVFTATSGKLRGLRAVYLTLDYGDVIGRSEIRTNIAYLSGVDPDELERRIWQACGALALSDDPAGDRARVDAILPGAPTGVRLLVETALADAAARRAGVSAAALLAGGASPPALRSPTNQTLFLLSDADLLARAETYVRRGFRALKLRMGAGDPAQDLARARLLRERLGATAELSCDANGGWSRETAARMAAALKELDFDYVEQPLPAEDLDGAVALTRATGMRVMLDESVAGLEAVRRAAETRAGLMLHLKLAKLGGLDRLMAAAKIARENGAAIMVGQMNEGALATATALAAAAALSPERAELYGGDNLVDDPFEGLTYRDGFVEAAGDVGYGVWPGPGFVEGDAP